MSYLLAVESVVEYLRERGNVPADVPLTTERLDGGVSNDVVAVTGADVDLVVKQALPRLRVKQEWQAAVERVLTEAAALRVAARLRPAEVPAVVDVDDRSMILTITRASRSLRNWKTQLLEGRVERATAATLAGALAEWHSSTSHDPDMPRRFSTAAFDQLRIDPFYRTVAAKHPAHAARINALADELLTWRRCLVHGDFSPKNVLADGDEVCVLDWEVAHYGDPVFDLAFLQTHLLLKALHRPTNRAAYALVAAEFLRVYADKVHSSLQRPDDYLAGHVACLLLARVDGKSPAEYLTAPERSRARQMALEALATAGATIRTLWQQARTGDRLGSSAAGRSPSATERCHEQSVRPDVY